MSTAVGSRDGLVIVLLSHRFRPAGSRGRSDRVEPAAAPEYLHMQAQGDDGHRAPVSVVSRIRDELVVHRQGDPFYDLHQVVRLDDGLRAVAEPSVAQLESE